MTGAQTYPEVIDLGARDRLVSRLREVLPRVLSNDPISLAYLYGSTVTGLTTPFSDIDIALVTDEEMAPLDRLNLMLRVRIDLEEECDSPDIDVRVINDAPLILQGKVVTDGIPVYVKDERRRIEFETSTRMRYFDYLPVHRARQDIFFENLRKRGLHG